MTLAKMPKYDRYKDSGVEWLGEIPENWLLLKLGSCLKPSSEKNHPALPLLSITREKGVILRDVDDQGSNHNFIPDDLSGYKLLKKGQFGMNKMKAWQGSYGVSEYTGIVSPAYFIFDFTKDVDPDFFHWAVRSKLYVSFFASASDGVRIGQWDLSQVRMKAIPFLVPSQTEQTQIANFLDQKTAQIDQAVAIKEKQIALLKERKQILIQNAVTQGLNPYAPMKDSGIDWIDKIPEHWRLSLIKHFSDILPGYAFKSEQYTNNERDIRLMRGINVSPNLIKWDETVYWPKTKVKGLEQFVLVEGDIVMAMDRPWVSNGIRVSKVRDEDLPSLLLQRVARIRGENGMLNDYLFLLLTTNLFKSYFEPMLTGISVPHISSEQIEGFTAPIPPENEQLEILEYIETQSQKIDQVIALQQQQIDKLKEYKTTLINSAVTGKIKITSDMMSRVTDELCE